MIKKLFILLCLCCIGIGTAWGEGKSYTEFFTIKSSDVVSGTGYSEHIKGVDSNLYNTAWVITFGGNNKSVGTNSSKRSSCILGDKYAKYAVYPVTTSDVASAFVSTTSISDIAKISYTFNGGSNQTNTKVYLIYSSDGTSFSQVSLTKGTQGSAISSGTEYEFNKCSGYFGLLFVATNSSGNWRIDDVNIKFYKEAETGNAFNVIVDNNIKNGSLTVTPNANVPATTTVTITPNPEAGYTLDEMLALGATSGDEISISNTNGIYTFEMPSENVYVTATFKELPKHTVTLVQPEGASLTINGGTDAVEMYEGQQIAISYSNLQRGYQWGKWTVVEGQGSKVTSPSAQNTKFTMGTENATLSAQVNKLPTYIVTFIDKGTVYATKQVYKTETFAEALNEVTNPTNDNTNFAGYSFKGWSTVQDADAPSFVDPTAKVLGNTALYAIYEKAGTTSWTQATSISVGDEVVIAEIDHVAEGKTGKELSSFSTTSTVYGIGSDFETTPAGTLSFIVEEGASTGTLAFKNTQGNNYLCWTSGNSISQQSTKNEKSSWNVTTSGERVKLANFNTSTRILAWNQQSPRFACYDNKEHGEEVSTGSTNYYYYPVFYVKSGSNEFSLEGGEVAVATMTTNGYATFSSDYALDLANLPEGLTAYQAEEVGDNAIKMTEVTTAVEANTGLFLAGTTNTSYAIPVAESGTTLTDNLLVATDGNEVAAGSYVYVIARNAFSPLANATTVSKGKAYIAASVGAKGDLEVIFGEPTGIEQVNNIKSENSKMYNLQGVLVNKNYNGIVIVNGKKYLNK